MRGITRSRASPSLFPIAAATAVGSHGEHGFEYEQDAVISSAATVTTTVRDATW